ncbi:MAG: YdeI/OmpD-associated family protein [Sphingomonadaceae bacterium]|nr:YdeI/OmpD-associated family protein [Sphingomonadaceae bacterium]
MKRDQRIDAYIAKAKPFAQPILERIRAAFDAACPECEETLKWGAPAFVYKGRTLAIMASFKAHAVLSLQRAEEIDFAAAGLERRGGDAMGQLGRIESAETLPSQRAIETLIRAAMVLEDAGPKKSMAVKRGPVKVPPIPDAFARALADSPAAKGHFDGFPSGAQRDYVAWIADAKREATRDKRIAQAIEWLAEGKKHNWKYESC